jgi:tetratricopeptide (TPR) repeat protein
MLAVHTLSKAGESEATNVARVYSDMAMLYVRSGDVRLAELYLQEASRSERRARNPDKLEQFAHRDALIHLAYLKGRLSDALQITSELIGLYGTDGSISTALRAHLYRDYGQLCAAMGKLDESITYLDHSLALQLKSPAASPQELAFSWAFLARIQIHRKQFDTAEATLTKAQNRIRPFQHDFPDDAAIVAETYGFLLNLESRWAEARTQLQLALQLAGSAPELRLMKLEDLHALARVDHRLHNKAEEKQVRAELKLVGARRRSPWKPDTVDILTLAENHGAPKR